MKITKNIGMLLLAIFLIRLGLGCAYPGSEWPGPDPGDPRHRGRHLHPAGPLGQ